MLSNKDENEKIFIVNGEIYKIFLSYSLESMLYSSIPYFLLYLLYCKKFYFEIE